MEPTSRIDFCGINRKIFWKSSNLEIMFYGFPKEKKHIWANSWKGGLVHLGYNNIYPIILFFLFPLTILNQTQYWSMLISWNHIHMWIRHTKGDLKFKGLEFFTIHRWRLHGRNILWRFKRSKRNKDYWDISVNNYIKKP
jgi:hypothetical protein